MYRSIVLFLSKIILYNKRVNNLELSSDHRSSLESLNTLLSKSLPHFEFLWTKGGQEKYITLACFAGDYESKELVPENLVLKESESYSEEVEEILKAIFYEEEKEREFECEQPPIIDSSFIEQNKIIIPSPLKHEENNKEDKRIAQKYFIDIIKNGNKNRVKKIIELSKQTERDGTQKTRGIYIFGNSRFDLFFKYLRNLKMGNYKILLKYTKNNKNYQIRSN